MADCSPVSKVPIEKFYGDARTYWDNVEPSANGMMGGLDYLSSPDLTASSQFLYPIDKAIKKRFPKDVIRACDCGAGIGRVTKCLLSFFADKIDMVEQTRAFLDKSSFYLGSEGNEKVDKRICSSLQSFHPEKDRYHVIWCQWVLSCLVDEDLRAFLARCAASIKEGGAIVLKENICPQDKEEFDPVDSSVCRTEAQFKSIFTQVGIEVVREAWQPNFPKSLYPVKMFQLRPKPLFQTINAPS